MPCACRRIAWPAALVPSRRPIDEGEASLHHLLIETLILAGLALLLFAALHDIGFRTVPDCVSVALLAIGICWRLADRPALLLPGAAITITILLFTYWLWRRGWMGGGDVKLLTAAGMFVPPWLVPQLIFGTALAGGVLAIFYFLGGVVVKRPRGAARPANFIARVLRCEQWRLSRRGPLPYATAIAAGGVLATLNT
jgi:prepilin peptidase CpaA